MRRRAILSAVRAGKPGLAARLIGRRDPFPETALFRGVDHTVSRNDWDGLRALAPLARQSRPFAARVWRALCLWPDHPAQAQTALARMGADDTEHGFNRMGARAWAMYLTLPRLPTTPSSTGPKDDGPDVFQFWDTDPPDDVSTAMDEWRQGAAHYQSYDLEMAATYIRRATSAREEALFRAAPHAAVQSDYFRLCRLMTDGGLYVDADGQRQPNASAYCKRVSGRTAIWLRTRTPSMSITNSFFAAPKGARLITKAFEEASRRLTDPAPRHVFEYAGPTLLTETALHLSDAGDLGDIFAMTDDEVSSEAMAQFAASYKSDMRNWHLWQAGRS